MTTTEQKNKMNTGRYNANKVNGNRFERDFCNRVAKYGFWVHNFAQNKDGQPADVIAVKNGKAYLIDCKNCEANIFNLSRVEENQKNAMRLWSERGNGVGYFAIKMSEVVFMVTLDTLENFIEDGKKILDIETIWKNGEVLETWLEKRQ